MWHVYKVIHCCLHRVVLLSFDPAAAAAPAHSTARGVVGLSRLLAKTFTAKSSDAVSTEPPSPTNAASATANRHESISFATVPVSLSTASLSLTSTLLFAVGSVTSSSASGSISSSTQALNLSASSCNSAAAISSLVTIAAPSSESASVHVPESAGVPDPLPEAVPGPESVDVSSQVYSGVALSSATTFAGDVPSHNGSLSATSMPTAAESTEPSCKTLVSRTLYDTQEPNTCGKEELNCDTVTSFDVDSVDHMNDVDCPSSSRAVSTASVDTASSLSPTNTCNETTDVKNSQVSPVATIQFSDRPRSRRGTGSISQAESCDNSNTNVNILNKPTLMEENVTSSGDNTSSAVVSDHLPSLLNSSDSINQVRSPAPLTHNELLLRNAVADSPEGLATSDPVPPQQETQSGCALVAAVSSVIDSPQSVDRSDATVSSEVPGVVSAPDKSLPAENQRTSPASVFGGLVSWNFLVTRVTGIRYDSQPSRCLCSADCYT